MLGESGYQSGSDEDMQQGGSSRSIAVSGSDGVEPAVEVFCKVGNGGQYPVVKGLMVYDCHRRREIKNQPADHRDHVELPEDYLEKAKEIYSFQASHPVDESLRGGFIKIRPCIRQSIPRESVDKRSLQYRSGEILG